jgi:hypothetical protein
MKPRDGRRERGTVVTEPVATRSEYQRLWRERSPERQKVLKGRTAARTAAALRVAKRHPDEFAREIRKEEKKRGVA